MAKKGQISRRDRQLLREAAHWEQAVATRNDDKVRQDHVPRPREQPLQPIVQQPEVARRDSLEDRLARLEATVEDRWEAHEKHVSWDRGDHNTLITRIARLEKILNMLVDLLTQEDEPEETLPVTIHAPTTEPPPDIELWGIVDDEQPATEAQAPAAPPAALAQAEQNPVEQPSPTVEPTRPDQAAQPQGIRKLATQVVKREAVEFWKEGKQLFRTATQTIGNTGNRPPDQPNT